VAVQTHHYSEWSDGQFYLTDFNSVALSDTRIAGTMQEETVRRMQPTSQHAFEIDQRCHMMVKHMAKMLEAGWQIRSANTVSLAIMHGPSAPTQSPVNALAVTYKRD
jgi:hypothetical protein